MITWALSLMSRNVLLITILVLVPAIGRVIQTDEVRIVNKQTYWLIEIIVEGARVILFIFLIGSGVFSLGIERIKSIFKTPKMQWYVIPSTVFHSIKTHYFELLATTVVFTLLAFLLNSLIQYLVSDEKLLLSIHKNTTLKFLNKTSLSLFLKNLSVIPLTLFYEAWLILTLLNLLSTVHSGLKQ
ncbi:hypothetical protein FKZ61_008170 [Litorilinea aerophila]|uniref:Uncharacterized protein n=1 Tax=Litorilinea aerophila TaxID=1204385 RepID=A0A540VK07_9CHLR|nr:hypothetical protein [Litorilinea aerophila]MCC9076085.1 hypothetical protein [Litorilinea aerophila]